MASLNIKKSFLHLVIALVEQYRSNDWSTHESSHGIYGQRTLESRHPRYKVADKCESRTRQCRSRHQMTMVGDAAQPGR